MAEEEEGSVLGTREHWETAYEQELAAFKSRGDAGEVWFGEETQATMTAFTGAVVDAAQHPAGGTPGRASWRALDLGCGNGALAVALAQAGRVIFTAAMAQFEAKGMCRFTDVLGVDYVPASVQLASAVAAVAGFPQLAFQARSAALTGLCLADGPLGGQRS